MLKSVASLVLLSAGLSGTAYGQSGEPNSHQTDRDFISEAASSDRTEVRLGQMASFKDQNDEVREFARPMISDNREAGKQIVLLASAEGVTLSTALSDGDVARIGLLAQFSGYVFDQKYMSEMVRDHQRGVSAYEKEARYGKDLQVRDWASKALPRLREQLKLARVIEHQIRLTQAPVAVQRN